MCELDPAADANDRTGMGLKKKFFYKFYYYYIYYYI
jgi:hypothetical protein